MEVFIITNTENKTAGTSPRHHRGRSVSPDTGMYFSEIFLKKFQQLWKSKEPQIVHFQKNLVHKCRSFFHACESA